MTVGKTDIKTYSMQMRLHKQLCIKEITISLILMKTALLFTTTTTVRVTLQFEAKHIKLMEYFREKPSHLLTFHTNVPALFHEDLYAR